MKERKDGVAEGIGRGEGERRIISSKLSTFSSKMLSQMVTSEQKLDKAANV